MQCNKNKYGEDIPAVRPPCSRPGHATSASTRRMAHLRKVKHKVSDQTTISWTAKVSNNGTVLSHAYFLILCGSQRMCSTANR